MTHSKTARLTAVSVLAMISSGAAFAQSTASQLDDVIVTAAQKKAIAGLIQAEDAAKTRSSITAEFIEKQSAGQSILQTINLLPGVNFTNNDPYGGSGGNLRIRGFDGPRISLTFDGVPLNDTGNYAIFSNQQLDPELIERANVNLGTTDVDSPTASATGGTVNYVTRKPSDDLGVTAVGSLGSFNYKRVFGMIDTGQLGPFGTKAFFAASLTDYDKFKGPGSLNKKQFNARIYQSIGDHSFVSVSGHYNVNRNNFYRNPTLAQYIAQGDTFENLDTYTRATPVAGVANFDTLGDANGVDSQANTGRGVNYFGVRINPSNTGNVRVQGKFQLMDGLIFTFDPSFQYVLANGGGSQVFREIDPRLRGTATATGVDLNGDGDVLDSVRVYAPNTTNTRRFGLTSSLVWDINDQNRVRVAYTFDRGRHRQTGIAGLLGVDGTPENVFAGLKGKSIATADGNVLRTRDRLSIALLNQVSGEYTLKLFDEKLRITAGVRAPYFKRDLNNYCYLLSGVSSTAFPAGTQALNTSQFCTTGATVVAGTPVIVNGVSNPGFILRSANGTSLTNSLLASQIVAPFAAKVKYDKILPNFGISYNIGDGSKIYASYSEGLSAPRTDDLYDLRITPAVPETTTAYDLGYRYNKGPVTASVALWYNKFSNRIVRAFDQDAGISISRNVGDVNLYGMDAEAGFQPTDHLNLYISTSYVHSEIKSDLLLSRGTYLPTKGKQFVETPEFTVSGRVEYHVGGFSAGAQAKYVGERFSTDVNDEKSPGYFTADFDARYKLDGLFNLKDSYIQLNVTNLLNKGYLAGISTQTNAKAIAAGTLVNGVANLNAIGASAPTYTVGAPRAVQASLRIGL
jgi:iron complex outermembrane recepter protein